MSKWTDVRDSVIDAIQFDDVGKSMKDELVSWLRMMVLSLPRHLLTELSQSARRTHRMRQDGVRSAILSSCR